MLNLKFDRRYSTPAAILTDAIQRHLAEPASAIFLAHKEVCDDALKPDKFEIVIESQDDVARDCASTLDDPNASQRFIPQQLAQRGPDAFSDRSECRRSDSTRGSDPSAADDRRCEPFSKPLGPASVAQTSVCGLSVSSGTVAQTEVCATKSHLISARAAPSARCAAEARMRPTAESCRCPCCTPGTSACP